MRVVRPQRDSRRCAGNSQVGFQRDQGLDHVAVSQVPGGHTGLEHGPVVLLCVANEARVLLCMEGFIPVRTRRQRRRSGSKGHVAQDLHDLVLTTSLEAEAGGVSIGLGVFSGMVEAGVAGLGTLRRFRVDFDEVVEHHLHGVEQAVEIEPVEANPVAGAEGGVVVAQPFDKLSHNRVAPHPGWKALKA